MRLSELKTALADMDELSFILPNGSAVPSHIHVTEIGLVTKRFIDCGGAVRENRCINFQLWEDGDFDHRLAPQKLASIIDLAERQLQLGDGEIEVEYQGDTICSYGLEVEDGRLLLTRRNTDCLAREGNSQACRPTVKLFGSASAGTSCTSTGCC